MIAGVCGGLGRYAGIDPVIFRIVLAVLAIFGGVGLLLYALAWLFVPDDNATESEAHRLFQGHARLPVVPAVIVGVLGVLALISLSDHGIGGPIAVIVIIAALAAIVANRRSPWPTQGTDAGPFTGSQAGRPAGPPPGPAGAAFTGPTPQASVPLGPPAGYAPSRPVWAPPPPPVQPRPPRAPSLLAPIALSLGVIVAGVLFALGASGAVHITAEAIFAAALLTVGLALVLSTWIGRARGLIAVGALLAVALVVAGAIDIPLRGGIGNRVDVPTSVRDLRSSYHLGIGAENLDLSQLALAGSTAHVQATVGVGQLHVQVPDNVKVVVTGRANTGQVVLFGQHTTTGHVTRSATSIPSGTSAGEIDLDLRVGVGQVEVDRVAAGIGGGA